MGLGFVLLSRELWRMAVLWVVSLLYSYYLLLFKSSSVGRRGVGPLTMSSFSPSPSPVCVVTGATSGLGAAAAKDLAGKGYHVVLVGRSLQQLSETIQGIEQQNSCAKLKGFKVDLSSIHSMVRFKSSLEDWLIKSDIHPSVQLLINNAGILATSYRPTRDGYDQMIATNYISAFVLSNLLLPLLETSPVPSRVVNVTSFTHRCVFDVPPIIDYLKGLSRLERYPFAHTYEFSKFCLLQLTYEFDRKLRLMGLAGKVSVLAADPGSVKTNIMRELPNYLSGLGFIGLRLLRLLQTPKVGVASITDAALAPPEMSGEYFFGGKGRIIRSSALSYDTEHAQELWDDSIVLFREAMSTWEGSNDTDNLLLFKT